MFGALLAERNIGWKCTRFDRDVDEARLVEERLFTSCAYPAVVYGRESRRSAAEFTAAATPSTPPPGRGIHGAKTTGAPANCTVLSRNCSRALHHSQLRFVKIWCRDTDSFQRRNICRDFPSKAACTSFVGHVVEV